MIPTVEAVIDEQGHRDRLRLERITSQPIAALPWCTRGLLLVLAATSMLLGPPAPGAAQPLVYVSNSRAASLSVVDARAGRVTGGVSFSVGTDPMGVAVSPDGRFAYVTNTVSSSVSVIETGTNSVTATIPVGDVPSTVAFTPDGRFAYVTSTCGHDRASICATGDVAVIDTGSYAVLAIITVGERPEGIAITPDGTRAYVANTFSNSISIIDTATNVVTGEIAFPPSSTPASIAIPPDGARLYVVSVDAGAVAVVDTATSIVTAMLPVGNIPLRIALTPDGRFAYVTNAVGSRVTVIDTASNTIVANIPARSPEAVAVTPEGAFAYVTDPDAGGVLRIDTREHGRRDDRAPGPRAPGYRDHTRWADGVRGRLSPCVGLRDRSRREHDRRHRSRRPQSCGDRRERDR
jgi:YVTN family beta-propeller protein